jgi:altronate dehydratase
MNEKSNALKIDDKDNVAVATQVIAKGKEVVVSGTVVCKAAEDIPSAHKVALVAIPQGGKVIRYGEVIVEASCPIARGGWVHVHNTRPVMSG